MSKLVIVSVMALAGALFCIGCGSSSEPDEKTLHKELSGPPSSANIRAHKMQGVGQSKAGVKMPDAGGPAAPPAGGTTG